MCFWFLIKAVSLSVEQQFLARQPNAGVDIAGRPYVVDFDKGIQFGKFGSLTWALFAFLGGRRCDSVHGGVMQLGVPPCLSVEYQACMGEYQACLSGHHRLAFR